jgi:cytochrome c oxidase subunit 3
MDDALEQPVKSPRFRLGTGMVGMWVALVSIGAFFIALVLAFYFVLDTHPWLVRVRIPIQLWISTALLVFSSLALLLARFSMRLARFDQYRRRLLVTIGIGVLFLISQLSAWQDLASQGVYVEGNPHGSMFYVFTGFHGFHVIGGLMALLYLYRKARTIRPESGEQWLRKHRELGGTVSAYWHFMGILWIFLFVLLYLWN